MKRPFPWLMPVLAGWCLQLLAPMVTAQEVFVPPQQHPRERYEKSWEKNPFTLKTAPVVEEKKSFAKDLVLHNVYRVMDEVTVVLANTKTREFLRLKSKEPAANGMKIRSVMIKDSRKDTYVEVELNGESAVLRHDDSFRKQMLASNSARPNRGGAASEEKGKEKAAEASGPSAHPPGGIPGQGPGAGTPATPSRSPAAARAPLPPRPTPQPDTPAHTPPPGTPSIRPGGPRTLPIPSRITPTRGSRRFFTAPTPAPPPPPQPAAAETP